MKKDKIRNEAMENGRKVKNVQGMAIKP